jgi:hypothetical protein
MSYDEPTKTSSKAILGAGVTQRHTRMIISRLVGEDNTPSLMAINKWSRETEKYPNIEGRDNYSRDSYRIQAITCFPVLKFGKVYFAFPVSLPLQNRIIAVASTSTGFDGILSAIAFAKIYTPVPPEEIVISDRTLSVDPILLEIGGRELVEFFANARVRISNELNPNKEDYFKVMKFLDI